MRFAAVEANSTRPLWAQKGRCGQMGVPGRERPTAGREWGKMGVPGGVMRPTAGQMGGRRPLWALFCTWAGRWARVAA